MKDLAGSAGSADSTVVNTAEGLQSPTTADRESQYVKKLRQSPTTNKLFKKYQWNEMKSGWNPFF